MCLRPGQWQHEKDGATEMNDLTGNQYDMLYRVAAVKSAAAAEMSSALRTVKI